MTLFLALDGHWSLKDASNKLLFGLLLGLVGSVWDAV